MNPVYPWSAVVGQESLKRALLLCAIDPAIGGVLVQGPRGVAKTTLARALSELVLGRFVELPLGATEERVTGTLDLDSALREGKIEFSPGLLSRAHEGVLYVDEINLLPDPLVDLLLDAAATGQNVVERDGVSHVHPARFVLVGTMNPEEGELRPQLIDRFGLSVHAQHEIAPGERAEIVRRRLDFDRDPAAFVARFGAEQQALVERCAGARARLAAIPLAGSALERVTERCYAARVEGVRADLAMLRAARAHAAWYARAEIGAEDVDAVAEFALAHRRSDEPVPPSSPPRGGAAGGGSGAPPRQAGRAGEGAAPSGDGLAPNADESHASGACEREPTGPGAGAGGDSGDGDNVHGAREAASRSRSTASHAVTGQAGSGGALPAVPVRAVPVARLPAAITGLRGQRPLVQRRGAPQLRAATGSRARGRARVGPIDWFATLVRSRRPRRGDLVHRARRAPSSQLWILALDCSASMLRGGGLAAAKGVAHALEARAVRSGAHVALISFRGAGARTEVTSRAGRAVLARTISELGGGGGTPLRHAVLEALALCGRRAWRSRAIAKRLVLLTDGRTRERVDDLASGRLELELVVIDCERGPLRLGRAPAIAAALGGDCYHVDTFG